MIVFIRNFIYNKNNICKFSQSFHFHLKDSNSTNFWEPGKEESDLFHVPIIMGDILLCFIKHHAEVTMFECIENCDCPKMAWLYE